jgi:hypothetical protein
MKELLLHSLSATRKPGRGKRRPRFSLWDCTHDQRKADHAILERLRSGKKVHSVDLSSATDLFPLDLQLLLLKSFIRKEDHDLVDFLEDVSRSSWELRLTDKRQMSHEVSWMKGQPLGLGPSFPLFAMSHGALLFALNGYEWENSFYILGDDVVILDDDLSIRYRQVLKDLHCEISEKKSFSSSVFAQFGGRNYTPTRAFWVPKWVKHTRDSILDIIRWWGPDLLPLVKDKTDRKLAMQVLELPQPWGAGWNPDGKPLSERLTEELVAILIEDKEEVGLHSDVQPYPKQLEVSPNWDYDLYQRYYVPMIDPVRLLRQQQVKTILPPRFGYFLQHLVGIHHPKLGRFLPRVLRETQSKDPFTLGALSHWRKVFKRLSQY